MNSLSILSSLSISGLMSSGSEEIHHFSKASLCLLHGPRGETRIPNHNRDPWLREKVHALGRLLSLGGV